MSYGSDVDKKVSAELFPKFSDVPDLGVQLIQLQRELEVQNRLYEFLTQEYEQAKLQEIKDTPTVQVLDKAHPPYLRSKPKRGRMVMMMALASILGSLFLVAVLEFNIRLEGNSRYRYISSALIRDFRWVLRLLRIGSRPKE